MYVHFYQIIKSQGPGPYYSQHHADNKYFSGLEGKRTCFPWLGKWKKFENVLPEKKVTLPWLVNSDIVKHENLT